MKVAIINDTHFGVRNDNRVFLNKFREFYEKVFFPTLKETGIKHILHLGDLMDRRKYVNFTTARAMNEMFIDRLKEYGLTMDLILGNHDVYYRNTNEVNGAELLVDYDNINIIQSEAEEIELDGLKILMTPWINSSNQKSILESIEKTDASILMGHLEIAGFEMLRGTICDHGMDKGIFDKFSHVFSGHFHHPSRNGTIEYLGAPYEMNWGDHKGRRGFHIFDTETLELEFVSNPHTVFQKLHYDDSELTIEDIEAMDFSPVNDCFIKVIVGKRDNAYLFDLFLDKIHENSPADVKIVDDHNNLDSVVEGDLIDEAQDTREILKQYVKNVETTLDKSVLSARVLSLYQEALSV